jgi:hypothetical protein
LQLETKRNVIEHRHPRENAMVLEHQARAMPAVVSGAPEDHRAFSGLQELGDDSEECRLAAATRAHDAHELPNVSGQGYSVDGPYRTTPIHERVRYAVAAELEFCHPLPLSPLSGEYAFARVATTGRKEFITHKDND